MQVDYIKEAVVRGVKNAHGQETALMAEIYMEEEGHEADTVLRDIQEKLTSLPTYKMVSSVEIRTEPFAKTTSNKIKRTY